MGLGQGNKGKSMRKVGSFQQMVLQNVRQIPTEESHTKYLTSAPQNCQWHRKQGKSEKLLQPREG